MTLRILQVWHIGIYILSWGFGTCQAQIFNGGSGSGYGTTSHQQSSSSPLTHFSGGSSNGSSFTNFSQFSSGPTSHFDGGSNGGSSVVNSGIASLPVELVNFKASSHSIKMVLLSWVTVSEINNDHFIIEKSADGDQFSRINKVLGHGTSNQRHEYEFVDTTPFLDNYYRLKQVDFDGSFSYSPVIKFLLPINKGTIKIFPNPSHDKIKIALSTNNEHNMTTIHGLNGKLVKVYTYSNKSILEIDINSMDSGLYIVSVHSNNSVFVGPLIISNK